MTRVGDGTRLGLSPEEMWARTLQQKRESEARRRKNRREEVLQQKREEGVRSRAGYTRRSREWRQAHPERWKARIDRYNARYPEKQRARWAAASIPLGPCVVCGATEGVDRHHPDYSRPKDVVMLCRTHHVETHNAHK